MSRAHALVGAIVLLEMCFNRFLYTNLWSNVRVTHDNFWTYFLKAFNCLLSLWVASLVALSHNWSLVIDLAACMNVQVTDLPIILGNQVSYIFNLDYLCLVVCT